ncbi:Zn-dependent alcohol dehydrogenase [Microbacterium trichothecenolyticum]|uniref:Zn-dependent alcohol dehydrogenase n=1 Tax=Microbacterium trichothecenolyticum TaxID=69370 RepID=UPI001C6E34F2|nr:Zn-dependent alcohol dehydrogenase [Microbacterium trichothecenolyticum]MBW9122072.1 Zn-dependent alcohol dehydrogenase [Microbacterium trichothecenolyticum]
MKAAVLREIGGPFLIEDVDIDAPNAHEVLIDVKASGLCHSDLLYAQRGGIPVPIVMGHEVAGVVRAVGDAVTVFQPGDHVVGCIVRACFNCAHCRNGKPYQCEHPDAVERPADAPSRLRQGDENIAGFFSMSGFAEQMLAHENQLVRVPEDIPFDRACLLGCAVATGMGSALNTGQVRVGDTVAVFGCGGVGLNVVQGAALAGARRIIAIDPVADKRELAERFGATHTVDPLAADAVDAVIALNHGEGVDKAFEVAGRKDTFAQAVNVLGPQGIVLTVGVQRMNDPASVKIEKGVREPQHGIRGVHMGSTNPRIDLPFYAELYQQGRLNLDDLVSTRIALADINEAYANLEAGKVARAVIVFD